MSDRISAARSHTDFMPLQEQRMRIAFQKSGRLAEECFALLKDCGYEMPRNVDRLLYSVPNSQLDLLFVRSSDIPGFLARDKIDAGIIGENVFIETQNRNPMPDLQIWEKLGFSKCRLSIAVPKNGPFQAVKDLNGAIIATSYPATLKKFAEDNGINVDVENMDGSVEAAPEMGLADAICDIVQSGKTLETHKLKEIQSLFKSEAVVVAKSRIGAAKEMLLTGLINQIHSVRDARDNELVKFHIPRDALKQAAELFPPGATPTISQLGEDDRLIAVEVVWEKKERAKLNLLSQKGATRIIATPMTVSWRDEPFLPYFKRTVNAASYAAE